MKIEVLPKDPPPSSNVTIWRRPNGNLCVRDIHDEIHVYVPIELVTFEGDD